MGDTGYVILVVVCVVVFPILLCLFTAWCSGDIGSCSRNYDCQKRKVKKGAARTNHYQSQTALTWPDPAQKRPHSDTIIRDLKIGEGGNFVIQSTLERLQSEGLWSEPIDRYQQVTLLPNSAEGKSAEKFVLSKLSTHLPTEIVIIRVQNPSLFEKHFWKCKRHSYYNITGIDRDWTGHRMLWHGTSHSNIDGIAEAGFDPAKAKSSGALGLGTYFSTSAEYSHSYTVPDSDGWRYMILASVVIGEYAQGQHGATSAPYLPGSPIQYNSLVDQLHNPSVFMTFDSDSAYPSYIIKYKVQTVV